MAAYVPSKTVRVLLELTIQTKAPAVDVLHVVNMLLDAGVLQDAIANHDCEALPMRVTASQAHEGL